MILASDNATQSLTVELVAGRVEVQTMREASARVRAEIEACGMGSGAWSRKVGKGGAKVRDARGNVIAFVSFNGRVWDSDSLNANEILVGKAVSA